MGETMRFRDALNMISQKPSEWVMRTLLSSLFLSIIFSVVAYVLVEDVSFTLIVFLSSNILVIIFSIWYVYYRANELIENIDTILPDYLENVAGYIKAGFSPILALKSGLRDEFGILKETLEFATTKSLGPTPAEEEILKATAELGSEKLQRIITIFLTAYVSGGRVGTILERIAKDLREANDIKKKLITGVNVYIIFISISLIFILPLIISVSVKFLELGVGESGQLDIRTIATLGILMLTINSMLTGMFIGAIRHGRELMGFKHSIILAFFSNLMFIIYSNYVIPLILGISG